MKFSGTQLSFLSQVESYEINGSGGELRRPALRYFGGKWKLAPWILDHFPEHSTYCEPYAGAYSVGLRKAQAQVEILNELNPDVVNYFRVLKEWPQELIAALDDSPRTHAEFEKCKRIEGDSLERARRFYLYCQMSYGNGGGRWSSGTSEARLRLLEKESFNHLLLLSARLASVEIEQRPATDAISIHDSPETLFYCDPCYVQSVRGSKDARHINGAPRRQYAYEMSDDDHRRLADALHGCDGMVVLSGYESGLYAELFPGWRCVRKKARTSSRGQREECLWIKPKVGDPIWTSPDIMAASAAIGSISSKRKHRPKGGATGWLETRVGNRKRKNPTVSYYYRWDSPEGRITEYVAGSKLPFVNSMLKSGTPALDILRYVIAGKKKVSPTIQRILLANKNSRDA